MDADGIPVVVNYPCFLLMATKSAPFLMWAGKETGIVLFTDSDLLAKFRTGLEKESGDANKYSEMGALQFSNRATMLETLKDIQPALHAKGTTRIVLDPTVSGVVRSFGLSEFVSGFDRQ